MSKFVLAKNNLTCFINVYNLYKLQWLDNIILILTIKFQMGLSFQNIYIHIYGLDLFIQMKSHAALIYSNIWGISTLQKIRDWIPWKNLQADHKKGGWGRKKNINPVAVDCAQLYDLYIWEKVKDELTWVYRSWNLISLFEKWQAKCPFWSN